MEKTEKYIESLQGITYGQWIKLKIAVDRQFEMKRKELDSTIQLDTEKSTRYYPFAIWMYKRK